MKKRVLVLGAGFGGLEVCTLLSEMFGDKIEVTLIDKSDAFVFGFAKLDVMFGLKTIDEVRMPYKNFVKLGVKFLQQTITSIDPANKSITTDKGKFEADFLVVAIGLEYDLSSTPGLTEFGQEFYSVAGARKLSQIIPKFSKGNVVVGVCKPPIKCPPAPSEAVIMMHDNLVKRGVRTNCDITIVLPFQRPIPISAEASNALVAAYAERNIKYISEREVVAVKKNSVTLSDGKEISCDLFMGIPKHVGPKVLEGTGLIDSDGWVIVNPRTLETKFPSVYSIGDIADTGAPMAGAFAENAGKTVAARIISEIKNEKSNDLYAGKGACYFEYGDDKLGLVDIDFFSGPQPVSRFQGPSIELRKYKTEFGKSRSARWFGL